MEKISEWMIGLQVYAYDVNDGGTDPIIEIAQQIGAKIIFVAISYLDHITAKEESRAPRLQHNPHRKVHGIEAYIHPTPNRYPKGLIPPVGSDPGLDGDKAYKALKQAAEPLGIMVIPWILFLSQRIAEITPEVQVVNAAGDFVKGWLCPSKSETIKFVQGLVEDIIGRHNPPAIFVDGVRFPEPIKEGVINFCSCFCDSCFEQAEIRGIDLGIVRQFLLRQVETLENNPKMFSEAMEENLSTGFTILRKVSTHSSIIDWFKFRHSMIERIVATIQQSANGRTELWLDVWPPSYGWLLGQDLSLLSPYSQVTRPFTYHRLGGGADVPGLIKSITPEHDTQQALYQLFQAFFNFPGPVSFDQFFERGLDPEFITAESILTKEMLANQSKLLAGLQIWQVGVDGVYSALDHAFLAEPSGVVIHCYGWATSDELQAVGQWFMDRGIVSVKDL